MATKTVAADLPAEIFDVQVNVPLIHQVVVAQLAAARQGTHSTKTRGEVRGGGRKPYRQKGTGRARQGSTRAPQFAGGGVVHGPQPRDYSQRTPKKMKAAALRGALSDRARNDRVHVVDSLVTGDCAVHQGRARAARRPDRPPQPARRARPQRPRVAEVGPQPRGRPRARRRPAQHVRRAVRGRRRLHHGCPGGVRLQGPARGWRHRGRDRRRRSPRPTSRPRLPRPRSPRPRPTSAKAEKPAKAEAARLRSRQGGEARQGKAGRRGHRRWLRRRLGCRPRGRLRSGGLRGQGQQGLDEVPRPRLPLVRRDRR